MGDNAKEFKEPLVVAYYDVDYVKNIKGTNYWRNRVLKVAKDHAGYNFAVSNKDDFQHELGEFGLDFVAGDKPAVTARAGGLKYKMEAEFSVDNLKAFVEELKAGNLEAYIKSEAVPDSQGDVKVAVARNFDELGEKMKEEEVEIVKMDATANDVPPAYDVRGFPTLYWLPKDTKKPVAYNGGRELDDFVKYISEKATSELKGWDRKGK